MGITRSGMVLWLAWVVAAMLGAMVAVVGELRDFGFQFGYPPGSVGAEVSLVLAYSIGLAIFQFAVLRTVMRMPALHAAAWVAITILAGVGAYVATYAAVDSIPARGPFSRESIQMAMSFAFAVIEGFLLGGVLWTSLRLRSALFVWPAAQVAALAVDYTAFVWGPALQLLNRLPPLAEVLVGDALSGALYGAVTGIALVALRRRSRALLQ
jgi:hypothetical protein